MPQGYKYEIYDTVKKEYLPGPFQSKEVRRLIGIVGNIPEQVKSGILFKKRYRVTIIGEWTSIEEDWAEEWDKARMRLLRAGGKMAAEKGKVVNKSV